MKKTREKVQINISGDKAILKGVDNGFLLELTNGESYKLSNQLRSWEVSVYKNQKGGVLKLTKRNDYGKILEECRAYEGQIYLFAVTSGAARNGVFHRYIAPQNVLEQELDNLGLGRGKSKMIYVDSINVELTAGVLGEIKEKIYTDGECRLLRWEFANETSINQVTGGTYCIHFQIAKRVIIPKIWVTPQADLSVVAEKIKTWCRFWD